MSRRDKIRMTADEVREFLRAGRTIILTSIGKDGAPHPMPMWYGLDDEGAILMSTFTKSQKIRNLKRDPRVSLLVEAGDTYTELRGVVCYGTAELDPDPERIVAILAAVSKHRGDVAPGVPADAVRDAFRKQAPKRTGIRVLPDKIVSWDHRKLAGAY